MNSTIDYKPTAVDDVPRHQAEPPAPPANSATHWQRLRQWAVWGERRLARWAQPEASFWRLGLLFGLLFLVVTPPFQSPDEWAHFARAYHVAEGHPRPVRLGAAAVGAALPRSVETTIIEVSGNIKFNAGEKQAVDKIFPKLSAQSTPLNPHDRVFMDFRAVALNSPLPYLPQAFGIRLGMLFDLSPLAQSYLGRLSNLLVALLLTALAIHLLPLMKWGMLLLAMTPMAVFQRSSLSADVLLNTLAFLFIALVVRAAWPRTGRLTRGEVVALGGVALLLGLCKPPYIVLTLLCLLIPRARFGGTKQYLAAMAGILVTSALALALWMLTVRGLYSPVVGAPNTVAAATNADPNQMMVEQMRYVMQHPLRLAPLFWNTVRQEWYAYYLSFIGILGWLDTVLPMNLYYSYIVVLFLVALVDGDRRGALGRRARAWMLVVLALSLGALGVSLYVQWTPTGAGIIQGVQGRYFIPLAPLLFLPLALRRGAVDLTAKGLHWPLIGYLIWVMAATLRIMLHRYYLPAPV